MAMVDPVAPRSSQSTAAEEFIRRALDAKSVEEALGLLRSAAALLKGETTALSAWIDGLTGFMLYRAGNLHEARPHLEASERRWAGIPFEESPKRRAATLCNYANLLCDLGAYRAARSRMEATLRIERRILGADDPEYARTLANFARLLRITGQTEEACHHARFAAEILESGNAPRDQTDALYARNILGMALMDCGRWSEALVLFKTLLPRAEQADAPDIYYSVLNNVGWSLYGMGDYEGAASWEKMALDLVRNRSDDAARIAEATLLTNLAAVRHKFEDFEGACAAYAEAATALRKAVPDGQHPQMASVQCNWGAALYRLERFQEARSRYEQAFGLRKEIDGNTHQTTVDVLFHLAELTLAEGRDDEALEQAVAVLASPGLHSNPDGVWRVFNLISRALEAKGRNRLAILFGKQAVEVIESMRLGVLDLGKQAEALFTLSRANGYRTLADQLVTENRLIEAEHVLQRLRAAEQDDLFGRDAGAARSGQPGFSRQEEEWRERYTPASGRIIASRARLNEIVESGGNSEQSAAIRRDIAKAAYELSESVAALLRDGRPDDHAISASAEAADPPSYSLGPDDIFLHFFPAGSHYRVLRRDGQGNVVQKKIEADAAAISNLVLEFRRVVSDVSVPLGAVKAASLRLYDLLLRPILEDRAHPGARLLLWLDGALRFVPPAALFDGTHYLIERVPISLHSPFAGTTASRRSLARDGIAGFALDETIDGLPPLSFALAEVETVVDDESGTGLFTGERFLNERFTPDNLERAAGRFGGLLVASHFVLRPADLMRSGLLTGTGELMLLRELAALDFSGLSLATISCCDTGSAGLDGDAAILQSFADRLVLRGAGAVLASLWRVADAGSARLVIEFYAALASGEATDFAAALAHAQKLMARGRTPIAWPNGMTVRGIGSRSDDYYSPSIDFRHPYFWAPFVLVGDANGAQ